MKVWFLMGWMLLTTVAMAASSDSLLIRLNKTIDEYELMTDAVTRTVTLYLRAVFGGSQLRWSRWARSSSIEAKRIMPSGICASIEPSE